MKSDKKDQRPFPDFLVVGAARSGTSFLYSLLKNNPQIFLPRKKEPMFFCCWDEPDLLFLQIKATGADWISSSTILKTTNSCSPKRTKNKSEGNVRPDFYNSLIDKD